MPQPSEACLLSQLQSGPERVATVAGLIRGATSPDVLDAALAVMVETGDPELREAVRERYRLLSADGPRHDSGCGMRRALTRALRGVADASDQPILESAVWTYEFVRPGPREVAGDLRGEALLALADLDHALAAFHAVRLLTDGHTSPMSGQPALTAARVLAATDAVLPLYEYIMRHAADSPEVAAECLRSLSGLPGSLLTSLFEELAGSDDETVLLGLFDLVLPHAERARLRDSLATWLRETRFHDIFRYVVAAVVAGRDPHLLPMLDDDIAGADCSKQDPVDEARRLLPGRY